MILRRNINKMGRLHEEEVRDEQEIDRRRGGCTGTHRARGAARADAAADAAADAIRELKEILATVLERQSRLEDEVARLRARDAPPAARPDLEAAVKDVLRSLPPEDLAGGVRAAPKRDGRRLELGGYFSTRYVSSELPGEHGSFVDMRLVPQVHAEISPGLSFDAEIEIEHAGHGGPADGEVIVEMAELTAALDPAFSLVAGTILVPFGHFNLNHDDPMNELSSRPRVARYVVPSAFGLPGIGAKGMLEWEGTGVLTYKAALTNGFRNAFDESKGSRSARGLFEDDDNHDKTAFLRAAFAPSHPPIDALSVGVSAARGRLGSDGRGEHRLSGYGVDVQAKHGPWEFMGEFDRISIDRASGSAPAVLAGGMPGPVRGMGGWYAQLVHRFEGDWVRALPLAMDNASLGLVLRRDVVDLHDRVTGGSGQDDERAWSFGATYRPSARSAIKLEYRHAESPFDGPEGEKRDFFALEFATYF